MALLARLPPDSDAVRVSTSKKSWPLGWGTRHPGSSLVLAVSFGIACGGRVPVPAPGANSQCVQGCQASHAVCIQSSNVGAGGYGDARGAVIGGALLNAGA